MNISSDPWVWIAAILTLAIFSFLYRENPFYRFAEHLYVGVANGYAITFYWHRVLVPTLFDRVGGSAPLGTKLWLIAVALIGLLYFARFIPKASWLVRVPIAILLGYACGSSIPRAVEAEIIQQAKATVITPANFHNLWQGIWAVIILVGVICTMSYFFFSAEHRGALKPTAYAGVVFIMVGFGASFGYTVMARISLFIGRLQYLFSDWLGVVR